jgi:hypothetical protein
MEYPGQKKNKEIKRPTWEDICSKGIWLYMEPPIEKKKENKEMKETKWKWVGGQSSYSVPVNASTVDAVTEHLRKHGFKEEIWQTQIKTNFVMFTKSFNYSNFSMLHNTEITLDEFFNNFDKYVIKEESMKDGKDSGKKYKYSLARIVVTSEKLDRIVQERLFELGLSWAHGNNFKRWDMYPYVLFVNPKGDLGWAESEYKNEAASFTLDDLFSDTPSFLEEIKPEPEITKEEALRAIDESLEHWVEDGLKNTIAGKMHHMSGEDCALCELAGNHKKAIGSEQPSCDFCPFTIVGKAACSQNHNPYIPYPGVEASLNMIKLLWAVREEVENNWQKRMEGGK